MVIICTLVFMVYMVRQMVEHRTYFDDFVKLISKEESTVGKKWLL